MSAVSFELDAKRVPILTDLGLALKSHILQLCPDASFFLNDKKKWVISPNFVTLKFQPRVQTIRITVTGEPNKHQSIRSFELLKDQNGYSRFVINSITQLEEAKQVITRAYNLKRM